MADAWFTLPEMDPADVDTPVAGEFSFFVNTLVAGRPISYKDSLDAVRPFAPDQASMLLTADLPNPIVVDGTTPVADAFLIASSPTVASWAVPPGFMRMDTAAVKVAGFTAVAHKWYRCNINGGAFTAGLPLAASVPVDTAVSFKLVSESNGNLLTVDAAGADTIDNFVVPLPTVDIGASDGEWAVFRSDGVSIWYQLV